MRTRQSRPGFTLTEILMAVGILGIGMTMVASIFPVALDQSRRAQEQTMAALCARSTAATLRARRDIVTPTLRASFTSTSYDPLKAQTAEIAITGAMGNRYKIYNPDAFLYDNTPIRTYAAATTTSNTDPDLAWETGNFVPVILATPMITSTAAQYDGPWRVVIVVYKSRGSKPDFLNASSTGTPGTVKRLKDWAFSNVNRGGPGTYLVDWRPGDSTNFRGEAYLVDYAKTGAAAATDTIYLAAPTSTGAIVATTGTGTSVTGTAGLPGWVSLPGAITAFHTIIGD